MVPIASAAPPSQFPAGSSGLGDPYFPLDGNGGYDVQHYDLALTYDPATDRLTGIATITARATQNLSAFNFDFIGLRLRSLTVNGANAKTSRKGQELTVKPATGLTNGSTFTVVARYDGVPEPIVEEGLGELGFLPTEDGAIVQGEPHVAATWFPANDHPRDKASFTFHITIPTGLEAIANGVLVSQQPNGAWTTWNWNAAEPMVPYLAMMVIDDLEMRDYVVNGIAYWDAIDADLMVDGALGHAGGRLAVPLVAERRACLQAADPDDLGPGRRRHGLVPGQPGHRVLLRLPLRRVPDGRRRPTGRRCRTSTATRRQAFGACPFITEVNPFLLHYLTPIVVDPGDPGTPERRRAASANRPARPAPGTPISGAGDGWETWTVQLANAGASPRQVELSISYASDFFGPGPGVILDQVVVSTGEGSTGFEADGNTLDGWTTPAGAGPEPAQPEHLDHVQTSCPPCRDPARERSSRSTGSRRSSPGRPGYSVRIRGAAAGGVVQDGAVGFALENQTRPVYSPFFFGDEGNDFVVVHELAHQWFGDSLAVDTWNETWLNEGFATYTEWMWGEHEGFFTPQDV